MILFLQRLDAIQHVPYVMRLWKWISFGSQLPSSKFSKVKSLELSSYNRLTDLMPCKYERIRRDLERNSELLGIYYFTFIVQSASQPVFAIRSGNDWEPEILYRMQYAVCFVLLPLKNIVRCTLSVHQIHVMYDLTLARLYVLVKTEAQPPLNCKRTIFQFTTEYLWLQFP